jgi:hypothetical protein
MNKTASSRSVIAAPIMCVVMSWCIGTVALAEGFDVRNLNLHDDAYPESTIAKETKEQHDANLLMHSHDPADQVVEFYKEKGLESNLVHQDQNRVVLEKMVAPHVPLRVVISSKATRNRLSDNVLYRNLDIAAALGKHDTSELESVRRRFDGLKERFYADNPRSFLKECRQSGSAGLAQKEMSMEEQGRRMQELAMQGRMDELRKAAEAFGSTQGMASGAVTDQWDKEVMCLEELEKKSFPVEIEVTATRDDVLG